MTGYHSGGILEHYFLAHIENTRTNVQYVSDLAFSLDMALTAEVLCRTTPNICFGYKMANEIFLLFKVEDSKEITGSLQKVVSDLSSKVTSEYNASRINRIWMNPDKDFTKENILLFDTFKVKVFGVNDLKEVGAALMQKQRDLFRKFLVSAYKEHVPSSSVEDMELTKIKLHLTIFGVDPQLIPEGIKNGYLLHKTIEVQDVLFNNPDGEEVRVKNHMKTTWNLKEAPVFFNDFFIKSYL